MHARRVSTRNNNNKSRTTTKEQSTADDEGNLLLFMRESEKKRRRRVIKITLTPSRLIEILLLLLLGWFVYDNYKNGSINNSSNNNSNKTTSSTADDDVRARIKKIGLFFQKKMMTTTTIEKTKADEVDANGNDDDDNLANLGSKKKHSSIMDDDPLAELHVVSKHIVEEKGKEEDKEKKRDNDIDSSKRSKNATCKGVWSTLEFSECSVQCGNDGGLKFPRFEKDDEMDEDCVIPKPPTISGVKCNFGVECPQNCIGKFDDWTVCDEECGVGFRRRQFIIMQPQVGTGSRCTYANGYVASEKCFGTKTGTPFCQNRNCEGDFGAWTKCTKECGGGMRNRVYSQTQKAGMFGKPCPYPDKYREQEKCNEEECILPDFCEGRWKITEPCSTKCGGGKTTRAFFVTKEGKECPNEDVREVVACNTQGCPKPKDCGKWEPWSACSAPCGDGIQTRKYKRTGLAVFGGKCPEEDGSKQKRKCNLGDCENLCNGAFSDWDIECPICSSEGTYTQDIFRTRKYVIPDGQDTNSFAKCPHEAGYEEKQKCPNLLSTCPVRCIGEWSAFSKCTRDCDGGTMKKTFSIFRQAKGSGEQCDAKDGEVVEKTCNEQKCDRDCLGFWNKHTNCIVSAENNSKPETKCIGEKIERFDLIPPQIERHLGCSFPEIGGEIFGMYEGNRGWFKRVPCNTGDCIKNIDIQIVSDEDDDEAEDGKENDENTHVSKMRKKKRNSNSNSK